tara:strand:- start:3150 stop:3266 length:117 start_codon:yes stop_codon:yes gene_type:complete
MNTTLSDLVGTSLLPVDSLCNGELTDIAPQDSEAASTN